MSREAAEEFIRLAAGDESLQSALEGVEAASEMVEIGAGRGLAFTQEELAEVVGEVRRMQSELGEEELESVAGGFQGGDDIILRKRPGRPRYESIQLDRGFLLSASDLLKR